MREKKTLMLVESALAVALSVVLGLIGYKMPYGGSVTLEMLPLLVIAFRWGVGPAFLAGVVAGFVQLAVSPYVIHPVQLIMDYPLPYALVGLAGIFRSQVQSKNGGLYLVLGTFVGSVVRFVVHVLSGVIFFSSYAPEGQSPWIYSIIYNATYLIPSMILCMVVLLLIRKQLDREVGFIAR